jgi:hypothetical protein
MTTKARTDNVRLSGLIHVGGSPDRSGGGKGLWFCARHKVSESVRFRSRRQWLSRPASTTPRHGQKTIWSSVNSFATGSMHGREPAAGVIPPRASELVAEGKIPRHSVAIVQN